PGVLLNRTTLPSRRSSDLRRQRRGLGSIMDLERDLPPGARAVFTSHLPELLGRTTTETRELQVTSDAVLDGSPVRARMTGVFVRSEEHTSELQSRSELVCR